MAASIRGVIAGLDEQIAWVKQQISSKIDDDPELKGRADLLQTIPGLGDRTIPQLLAYIGQPQRFKTAKALVAYASLTPLVRQSGSSLDKRRGTRPAGTSRAQARAVLPGHGGCALQPRGGSVRAAPEGAAQARQGGHRGLHAQAPVDRPRRPSFWKAIRPRPSRASFNLTNKTVSLFRSAEHTTRLIPNRRCPSSAA